MKIITIGNEKGGVGKTTTAVTLAVGLARRGQRVLIIDGDPQGHATRAVGYNKEPGLFKLLAQGEAWRDIIRVVPPEWYMDEHGDGQLFLVPSDVSTRAIGDNLDSAMTPRRRFEQLQNVVDVIVVDTAPTPAAFTSTLVLATDYLLYTTVCEPWAFDGLHDSINRLEAVQKVRRESNMPDVQIMAIQSVKYLGNTVAHTEGFSQLHETYGSDLNVWSPIHQRIAWVESQHMQQSIFSYPDGGKARIEAENLIDRVMGVLYG